MGRWYVVTMSRLTLRSMTLTYRRAIGATVEWPVSSPCGHACTYSPAIPSSWPLISSRRRCPGWPQATACGAQRPGHRWRDVDDPVDVGGSASTAGSIRSIREWSMVGVVCGTTVFIDHAPAGPARASTAEGRAQQAGSAGGHARRTTESTTSTPPQAALTLISKDAKRKTWTLPCSTRCTPNY
jgi:hypothetical protein